MNKLNIEITSNASRMGGHLERFTVVSTRNGKPDASYPASSDVSEIIDSARQVIKEWTCDIESGKMAAEQIDQVRRMVENVPDWEKKAEPTMSKRQFVREYVLAQAQVWTVPDLIGFMAIDEDDADNRHPLVIDAEWAWDCIQELGDTVPRGAAGNENKKQGETG